MRKNLHVNTNKSLFALFDTVTRDGNTKLKFNFKLCYGLGNKVAFIGKSKYIN